jgi:hypothetical protein
MMGLDRNVLSWHPQMPLLELVTAQNVKNLRMLRISVTADARGGCLGRLLSVLLGTLLELVDDVVCQAGDDVGLKGRC